MADLREGSQDGTVSSDAFLGGPTTPPEVNNDTVIDIWPELILPIEVFLKCRLDYIPTMGGVLCNGLSVLEVEAACRVMRIPEDEANDVALDVIQAGQIAKELLNRRSN